MLRHSWTEWYWHWLSDRNEHPEYHVDFCWPLQIVQSKLTANWPVLKLLIVGDSPYLTRIDLALWVCVDEFQRMHTLIPLCELQERYLQTWPVHPVLVGPSFDKPLCFSAKRSQKLSYRTQRCLCRYVSTEMGVLELHNRHELHLRETNKFATLAELTNQNEATQLLPILGPMRKDVAWLYRWTKFR